MLAVEIQDGEFVPREKENCRYEKLRKKNAILLNKICNRGNDKIEGLILQTKDVQEHLKLSNTKNGIHFERTEIIRSTVLDVGVVSFTRSWIVTKSHSGVSPTIADEGGTMVKGQVSKF